MVKTQEFGPTPVLPGSARGVGLLWVAAPLAYLAAEALSSSAFPGYSYAANYISDLGVPDVGTFEGRHIDSPLHAVMNAGFVAQGLLFFIGLAMLAPMLRRTWSAAIFLLFGACHTAGIVLVAVVSGSEANALNGLGIWHGVGAVAAIAGGNLVAIVSGQAMSAAPFMRRAGTTLGLLGFVCALLLLSHVLLPDGVWERGAVYTFLAWELATGATLLGARR